VTYCSRRWERSYGQASRGIGPSPLATASAVIPTRRRPGIEVVDALTRVAHLVSSDALLAGRLAGIYPALCGARLLAASLTDPGRGRCMECAR
jgi:hypothetical protein